MHSGNLPECSDEKNVMNFLRELISKIDKNTPSKNYMKCLLQLYNMLQDEMEQLVTNYNIKTFLVIVMIIINKIKISMHDYYNCSSMASHKDCNQSSQMNKAKTVHKNGRKVHM